MNAVEKICTSCGKAVLQRFSHREKAQKNKRKRIYVDGSGRQWRAARCPSCWSAVQKEKWAKRRTKRGVRIRDENHPDSNTRGAFLSERLVAEFFEAFGYVVKQTNGQGPDLIVKMDDWLLRIEVKRAYQTERSRSLNSWRVDRVSEARKQDDLIAIVLPGNQIHIEKMSEHLSKCGQLSGKRYVNNLVRIRLKPESYRIHMQLSPGEGEGGPTGPQ